MDRRIVPLLLVVPLVAGCLGPASPNEQETVDDETLPVSPADVLVEDHDHGDPGLHAGSWNFEELSWRPLAETGETARIHALDTWGDYLFVDGGMTLGGSSEAGFHVVDVSDPEHPAVVASWSHEDHRGADRSIAVTPDGNWVFLASEGDTNETGSSAVFVVDVSDKTEPELATVRPFPYTGSHTVDAGIVDGDVYAFALAGGVSILRLESTPQGHELVEVGRYVAPGAEAIADGSSAGPQERTTEIVRTVYGHDMDFRIDEATGQPLLYVAYAYQGLHILDLSTPSAPEEISRWRPGGAGAPWYVHSVQTAHVDGQRVTVVGSEVFENRHETTPAPLWVLDTSDLSSPKEVGTWTNPSDAGSHSLLLSTHFFRIDDGTVHLAHYHGGVWSIDISTPDARSDPTATGYHMTTRDNGWRPPQGCCGNWNLEGMPMVFDVEVNDGTVWAADWFSGLYGLEPAS